MALVVRKSVSLEDFGEVSNTNCLSKARFFCSVSRRSRFNFS